PSKGDNFGAPFAVSTLSHGTSWFTQSLTSFWSFRPLWSFTSFSHIPLPNSPPPLLDDEAFLLQLLGQIRLRNLRVPRRPTGVDRVHVFAEAAPVHQVGHDEGVVRLDDMQRAQAD